MPKEREWPEVGAGAEAGKVVGGSKVLPDECFSFSMI